MRITQKIWLFSLLSLVALLSDVALSYAITLTAYVKNTSGVVLPGVTATVVEYPAITTTSDSTGLFVLAEIPANTPVQVRLSLSGYTPLYTAKISYAEDTNQSASFAYAMFTQTEYSNLGITSGMGLLQSRTRDYYNNNVPAIVTATGSTHGAYSVTYGADCSLTMPVANGTNTGRYCVKNVDNNDTITVTAAKDGYTFNTRTFIGHADALGQTSVKSTTAAPALTGFSPMAGIPGTSVVITGGNLNSGSPPVVSFNGTAATVTSTSFNQVIVTVPSGATSGPISVTTSGGTASSGTFTVLPAGSTTSATLSGTVSYNGAKSGRIYFKTDNGGEMGVSIPGTGAYRLSGLTSGWSYTVKAFMDTTNSGIQHANDPVAEISITNASAAHVANITLIDPASVAVAVPDEFGAIRANDNTGAFVMWSPPESNGLPIADSFTVAWSSDGSTVVGSKTIPSTGKNLFFHATTATYYYRITAHLNGTAASTGWQQVQSTGSVGHAISGTITYTGISPTGPIYLAAVTGEMTIYPIAITSPSANSTSFTVPNIPDGSYGLYGFLDMNNNGIDDEGDYRLMNDNGVRVTVAADNVTGVTVPFPVSNVSVVSSTRHYFYGEPGSDSSGEGYSYRFTISAQKKTPRNIALVAGANLTGPIDAAVDDDKGNYRAVINNVSTATAGDTYTLRMQYADASTEDITVVTHGPLPSPAMPVSPLFGIPFPANGKPVFTWQSPLTPPPSYSYYLELSDSNWNNRYVEADLPSSATSFDTGASSSATAIPGALSSYYWNLTVADDQENEVSYQAGFTTSQTTPVLTGITPAMATPGGTLTITGYNLNQVTSVNLGSFSPAISSQSSTQLVITLPGTIIGDNSLTVQYSGGSLSWLTRDGGHPVNIPTGTPGTLTVTVKNKNGALISGALVELVGNSAVTAISNGSGVAVVTGLPTSRTYRLRITAPGYQPLYTWDNMGTGSVSYILITAAQMVGVGNAPGKGMIFGAVRDNTTGNDLSGVTVSVSSMKGKAYAVAYYNSTADNFAGSLTDDSGIFLVQSVDHGDVLTIQAVKSGYTFPTAQCKGVVESVTQGAVMGGAVTPTITSYSATSGKVGSSVTLYGTNLINPINATVNGASTSVTPLTPTSVSVVVPAGATSTGVITVTTAAGTATGASQFTVLPNSLTVNLVGTGSGSVNATSGISFGCSSSSTGCTTDVTYGTHVTLAAAASLGSTFTGWSGACSVNPCTFTMDGDKTAVATFTLQQNGRIGGVYFGTLQSALNGAANSDVIQMQALTVPDISAVTYSRSGVTATLKGGYDSSFSLQTGYTGLDSVLILEQGTLIIDRLVIY